MLKNQTDDLKSAISADIPLTYRSLTDDTPLFSYRKSVRAREALRTRLTGEALA